ncbi:hypothetical protein [Roseovarius arcticus]|uniref:hypothetical protein n=1 Tax=Roseovarius arcticus TaxID=2547404 RepID=UPI0011107607|nr:hypothetical protein [Roseovarius arcticus]
MLRSQVFVYAIFAAVMAAPAMAHVEQTAHSHAGDFNWLVASLAIAGVLLLVVLRRRKAASRP